MYGELFEKLELKREKFMPYKGSDLQDFNNTLNFPWGYIKLMVTLGEARETRIVDF